MKNLLLILAFLVASSAAADVSPTVERCREARAKAWEDLRRDRLTKAPSGFDIAQFLKVAEGCSRAAEKASASRDAAYLAAESAVCRDIHARFDESQEREKRFEGQKRELWRGLEIVSALDGDRSPALLEILERLSMIEWDDEPVEAARLLDRRVEIARREYGETDARYAEVLRRAGGMYEPSYMGGERELRGADDPEAAERLYRSALEVLARGSQSVTSEEYVETLGALRYFYEGEGREKDAAQMDRLVQEVNLEIQVEEELSRLDEQEAKALEEESEPPAEDEEGESDPTTAKPQGRGGLTG